MKRLLPIILFFLLAVSPVSAAFSFQISSVNPSSISSPDQEVSVTLDISDLPSDSYFRVAFQKESGASYFGYIKNNAGSWVQIQSLSADCKNYYFIPEIASTSATLTLKIGESGHDTGDYLVKAHRFTATSCSSTDATNTGQIQLVLPTPVPTTVPTTTPTSIPTNTPIQVTNTPKPTSTPKPTKAPTLLPTSQVLAATVEVSPRLENTSVPAVVSTNNPQPTTHNRSIFAIIVILVGVVLLGVSLWLQLRKK